MPYQSCGLDKKIHRKAMDFLAERVVRNLNSASPTPIDLELGEFNPPEIKPHDKLEFGGLLSNYFLIFRVPQIYRIHQHNNQTTYQNKIQFDYKHW